MQTYVALSPGVDDDCPVLAVKTWTFVSCDRVRCVFELVEESSNCQIVGTSEDMRRIAKRILALAAEAEKLELDA